MNKTGHKDSSYT